MTYSIYIKPAFRLTWNYRTVYRNQSIKIRSFLNKYPFLIEGDRLYQESFRFVIERYFLLTGTATSNSSIVQLGESKAVVDIIVYNDSLCYQDAERDYALGSAGCLAFRWFPPHWSACQSSVVLNYYASQRSCMGNHDECCER